MDAGERVRRIRTGCATVTAGAVLFCVFLACGLHSTSDEDRYSPVIVFSAFVNGDSIYLPGSLNYPNTCALDGDTVKMDFYSTDYSITPPPQLSGGEHLKLHIRPRAADSIATTFTTRRIMVHFTRHQPMGTCTYEIVPADSTAGTKLVSMVVEHYDLRSGGSIAFHDIKMGSTPLGMGCGSMLDLTKGWIRGGVQ